MASAYRVWSAPYTTALPSFFFFAEPAPSEIYTLSLHDALPIFGFRCAAEVGWVPGEEQIVVMLPLDELPRPSPEDRKSTRLNSSHVEISYAVFCLKKKKTRTSLPHQPRLPTSRTSSGTATLDTY